jgi:arylsulfatase A-like enzyme
MKRRDFLSTIAAIPAAAQAPRARPTRPNILMLMADQHRADCVGVYGNKAIRTPNLDRIANEGVRFDCAYSSTPSCTPARSALLTGLSPWHHGMLGYSRIATRHAFEKPRALAEAGYYTTAIGKNHFYPIRNPHGYHQMILDEHCTYWMHNSKPEHAASGEERCDYEAWFWSQAPLGDPHATGLGWNDYRGKAFALPERLHATRWTGDTAVSFLESYERAEPFFLKVSFIRPHSPYDPPGRFLKAYEDAAIPEVKVGEWAGRYAARSGSGDDIWHGRLSADVVRQSRQAYYGSVSYVDEQIGRILETLEKRGMLDETLIVFTSDHGDMLSDQNLWRKSYGYEQSAHVPMLMRWPTGLLPAQRGQHMTQPVELRDVFPTFLEAAGVPVPQNLDGRSLLSLVRQRGEGWREYIDLEHNITYSPENHWNGLSDGRTKYIFHARDGEEQLFDLAADPQELVDLAGDAAQGERLRLWRGRMVEHLAERGEDFVKGGKLALRPKGLLTSPRFPGYQDDIVRASS